MGTPDYLSPEQARNLHKTDIRSDLYSLGCTFYFLLTGQVVFPGGGTLDKLIRHGAEKAPMCARHGRKRQRKWRISSQSCWRSIARSLSIAGGVGGGAGTVRRERTNAVGAAATTGGAV